MRMQRGEGSRAHAHAAGCGLPVQGLLQRQAHEERVTLAGYWPLQQTWWLREQAAGGSASEPCQLAHGGGARLVLGCICPRWTPEQHAGQRRPPASSGQGPARQAWFLACACLQRARGQPAELCCAAAAPGLCHAVGALLQVPELWTTLPAAAAAPVPSAIWQRAPEPVAGCQGHRTPAASGSSCCVEGQGLPSAWGLSSAVSGVRLAGQRQAAAEPSQQVAAVSFLPGLVAPGGVPAWSGFGARGACQAAAALLGSQRWGSRTGCWPGWTAEGAGRAPACWASRCSPAVRPAVPRWQ